MGRARAVLLGGGGAFGGFLDVYVGLVGVLGGGCRLFVGGVLVGACLLIGRAVRAAVGFLISGGEIDTERTANVLLEEFRSAKIGRITLDRPPEEKKC